MNNRSKKQGGFSLVELAVVLVIIGLLTTGGMMSLSSQRNTVKYSDSTKILNQAKKALLNYVMVNQYLPCPDTNNNGQENRQGNGTCTQVKGNLPYLTIGLRKIDAQDAFHHNLIYAVNTETTTLSKIKDKTKSASYFCNGTCSGGTALPVFNLDTPPSDANGVGTGNYDICKALDASCTASSALEAKNLVAVLVAKNKRGNPLGYPCSSLSGSEAENCDNDTFFQKGGYVTKPNTDIHYDDMVLGISGYELKNKLLALGSEALSSSLANPFTGTYTASAATGTSNGGTEGGNDGSSNNTPPNHSLSVHPAAPLAPKLPETTEAQNKGDAGSGYHKLRGTPHNDKIIAGNNWDEVALLPGDDQLQIGYSDGGWTKIDTGSGNNTIKAGDKWKEINSYNGDDNLTLGAGADEIKTRGGDDRVSVGDADPNAYAKIDMGAGNDHLIAGNNWDEIKLGSGDDRVQAGNGTQVLSLGSGKNDVNIGDAGVGYAKITASGSDLQTIVAGNAWDEINLTNSGGSKIKIGNGLTTIKLGSGDDMITAGDAGVGSSNVDSGSGNDTVNLGQNYDTIKLGGGDDILTVGQSPASGWRKIDAGSGNDTINVDSGYDVIDGGSGNDTVVFKGTASDWTHSTSGGDFYTHNATNIKTELKNIETVQFSG